jgi:hypothetical protein
MDSLLRSAGNGGNEGALLIARFAGVEFAWQNRAMGMGSVDADNGDGRQRLVRARGQRWRGGVGGWVVGGEDVQANIRLCGGGGTIPRLGSWHPQTRFVCVCFGRPQPGVCEELEASKPWGAKICREPQPKELPVKSTPMDYYMSTAL